MTQKKTKKSILYRAVPLKPLALGVAISGFLLPLLSQSPMQLAEDARSMLADSGATLSAAVPPNEYNTLAQQLEDKERSLNDREHALETGSRASSGDIFGLISLVLSLILCGLI